jgi:benzoylformate decarboxylase
MDFVSIAKGYGCDALRVENLDAIKEAAAKAWTKYVPTVLEIPISREIPALI